MSRRIGSDSSWLGNLALAVLAVVVIVFSAFVFMRDPGLPSDSLAPLSAPNASEPTFPTGSDNPAEPTEPAVDPLANIDTVLVIGDDGARLGGTLGRWPDRLAEAHGWSVKNLSRRGTGYATSAGPEACGLPVCPSFLDMIATAAKQEPPDLILVSGGVWDGELPRAQMRDAVSTFFVELRAAFPDTDIVAINPLEITQPLPAPIGPTKRAVVGAVRDVGGRFVDAKQPYGGEPPGPEGGPLIDAANTAILEAIDARLES